MEELSCLKRKRAAHRTVKKTLKAVHGLLKDYDESKKGERKAQQS